MLIWSIVSDKNGVICRSEKVVNPFNDTKIGKLVLRIKRFEGVDIFISNKLFDCTSTAVFW